MSQLGVLVKLGRRLSPVLSVLAAVLLLACGGKTEADSIDAARNLLAKGDFGSAAIELKSVLQKSPNLGEARYLLGVALIEQGEYGAALMELTKAQDQNFNSDLLSPKMARVLLATGKFKEVVQRYSAAVLKSPALQAELSTAVAVAHARMNQLKESESALDQALNADPKFVWALLTKARIRMAAGKFDEALAMIDAATVAGAPNGDAHILRAAILRFAKKDIEGAIKSYLAAAQDPQRSPGRAPWIDSTEPGAAST
jgi:tetratricopeptide (TPR) repeat protein